jgi:PAS domain-containing protein
MTTKQKGHIDLLLHVSQRKDMEGLVTGLVGVGQDITDQKRAEIEKSRIAQELQTFIDTANAPIFGIDSHGLVNEWNNKTAALTGFFREEVLGRDLVKVYGHLNCARHVLYVKKMRDPFETMFELDLTIFCAFTDIHPSRAARKYQGGAG